MTGTRLTTLLSIIGVVVALGVAAWFYQASGDDKSPDTTSMDEEKEG